MFDLNLGELFDQPLEPCKVDEELEACQFDSRLSLPKSSEFLLLWDKNESNKRGEMKHSFGLTNNTTSWDFVDDNLPSSSQSTSESGSECEPELKRRHIERDNSSNSIITSTNNDSKSLDVEIVVGSVLPQECEGIPIFRVNGEEVVFLTHILSRVLYCHCRSSNHFGMFRDKKFGEFRRTIDTSRWRVEHHYDTHYENFRSLYPLLRLRDSSIAITLEGLNKWCSSGKCSKFKLREEKKCRGKGCIKNRCTCPNDSKK